MAQGSLLGPKWWGRSDIKPENHSLDHDQGLACGCRTTAAQAKGRSLSLQAAPTGRRDACFWICCQVFFNVTIYTLSKTALCLDKPPERCMGENAPGAFTSLVTILEYLKEDFSWQKTTSAKTKNRVDMTHSCKIVNGTEKMITE